MAGKIVNLRDDEHVNLLREGLSLRQSISDMQTQLKDVEARLVKVANKQRKGEIAMVGTVTLRDGNDVDQVHHASTDTVAEVKVQWTVKYTVDDKLALALKSSLPATVWDGLFVQPPTKISRARSYDKTLKQLSPGTRKEVQAAVDEYHESGKVKW